MYEGMCLVLDLGGGQAASIARKVRGERIYCEVLPYDAPIDRIEKRAPLGLIIAGGAGNPFQDGAPVLPEATLKMDVPMLGLGFGAGVLMRALGARAVRSMPGRQTVEVTFSKDPLFDGLTESERLVERLEEVELPETCASIAQEAGGWSVAFASAASKRWGIQFYPEQNDPDGLRILSNFTQHICGCPQNWDIERFIEYEIAFIQRKVAQERVLMAISGGVDSVVCAALMRKAVGDRLQCIYIDTGFMRSGDGEVVRQAIEKIPGLQLSRFDMAEHFFERIQGVESPDEKRARISGELLGAFEECAGEMGGFACLARGTTYDDLLERGGERRTASERDSLREGFGLLLEPVCRLFKNEVRLLGEALGLPDEITRRQPFPGAGLAKRCLGAVTKERLSMLRASDRIFSEEIARAGLSHRIRQYFVVLTELETGGAPGRGSGYTAALRAVSWTHVDTASAYRLPYDLLERVVERITTEVEGINRVVYDVTGKPPAGIEWD